MICHTALQVQSTKFITHFNFESSSLLGHYAVSTRAELVAFEDERTTILRNFGNYLYQFAHSDVEKVLNLQCSFQNIKSSVMHFCSWSDLYVSVKKEQSFCVWDPCFRFWFHIRSTLTSMKLNISEKYKNRFFTSIKWRRMRASSLYRILGL